MFSNIKAKTPKADLGLTEEGHIFIKVHEDCDLDKKDIVKINEAKNSILKNNKNTVLYLASDTGSVSVEGREYCSSNDAYKNVKAKAIVCKSLSSRLLATFFTKNNKPPAPTEIFKDEFKAIEWLNTFI